MSSLIKVLRYTGLIDGLVKVLKNEGVGALWNGTKGDNNNLSNL